MFCLIDTSIRKTVYMHAHAIGISNFRFQLTGLFLIFKKFICFNWHSRLQWPIFTLLPKDLRCFMMFWLASPIFLDICSYAVCLHEKPMKFSRKRSLQA